MMQKLAVCTIITKSYLTYARTLAESTKKYNPNIEFYVLLADQIDHYFEPSHESFHWIYLSDLSDQDQVQQMCFYYTPFELCCALRGLLHEYMLNKTSAERWLFLDSDIMVFYSLEEVFQALETSSILLTPHSLTPLKADEQQYIDPHELNFIRSGSYNGGFLGLKRSEITANFIRWFKERLARFSFNDYGVADPRGLFVDQLWLNLVPLFFEQVAFLSHPGANLGHWNLFEKNIEKDYDNKIIVDGQPILFVHFSGWDLQEPEKVSKHNLLYEQRVIPYWTELATAYKNSLLNNGYQITCHYPYAFAQFQTGETITPAIRRLYFELLNQDQNKSYYIPPFNFPASFRSKFHTNTDSIYLLRQELERAQTQLEKLPPTTELPGINVAGFLKAELGIGEIARGYINALKQLKVPLELQDFSRHIYSRAEDQTLDDSLDDVSLVSPHPVNLICVNADFVSIFLDLVGQSYFDQKYNIGVWWWELPDFPQQWHEQFTYFDEIWVGSRYVYESISKHCPIPVVKIPPIVQIQLSQNYSKQYFSLDEQEFTFLFMFDFLSVFERKNPLAIIEAFRMTFREDEPVRLVLKCINSESDPDNFILLKNQIADSKITIIDSYLLKDEKNGLLKACDCYISLHCSEGFGLSLAEAMFLEKPVIATGWSGNMDFMNINNSYLVGYDLIRLPKNFGPYQQGQIWAQPDVKHAAQLMRHVYDNPEAAQVIAKRAAADIRQTYAPEVLSSFFKARLETMSQTKGHQLQQTQEKLQQTKEKLQRIELEHQQYQNIIEAMMTSKFWRLRSTWFKIKHKLGFVNQKEII